MDDLIKALIVALESGMEITVSLKKPATQAVKIESEVNRVTCPHCNWTHSYSRADNARRGLRAHSKHCVKRKEASKPLPPQWLIDQSEGKEL